MVPNKVGPASADVNRLDTGFALFKSWYKTACKSSICYCYKWNPRWLKGIEEMFIFWACLPRALDNTFCTVRFLILKIMSLYRYANIMIKLQSAQRRLSSLFNFVPPHLKTWYQAPILTLTCSCSSPEYWTGEPVRIATYVTLNHDNSYSLRLC